MKRLGWSVLLTAIALGAGTTRLQAQSSGNKVVLGSPELTSGLPGIGSLKMEEIEKWIGNTENHEVLEVSLPFGLAIGSKQITGLDANPMTRAKIELGRQLYFDTRLSADHDISCASCHHPHEGYSRHTRFGIGIERQQGGRNSPVSYNRILSGAQFWDGRAATLEDQAVGPIANPIEMGNTHEACVQSLAGIPGYVKQFHAVFGPDGMTIDSVGKAIAAFERALVTGPSEYDYYESFQRFAKMDPADLDDMKEDDPDSYQQYEALKRAVDRNSMSASAIRGRNLFFSEKVNCAACHVGANLTDEKYHNLGIGMDKKDPDLGRYVVTKDEKDKGAFKTPTIRNVALSAPYMHDGSLATLEETVEHYAKGGTPNMWLSDKIKKIEMTRQDKRDLVEFMRACTGPFPIVETGRLPE